MQRFVDIQKLICRFFSDDTDPRNVKELWRSCPNQMIWEALRGEDAVILSQEEVLRHLRQQPEMLVFTEPLPDLYLGTDVPCRLISGEDIVGNSEFWQQSVNERGHTILEIEPLYIVGLDLSWLIVVTPENTPDGGTLCVLVTAKRTD